MELSTCILFPVLTQFSTLSFYIFILALTSIGLFKIIFIIIIANNINCTGQPLTASVFSLCIDDAVVVEVTNPLSAIYVWFGAYYMLNL